MGKARIIDSLGDGLYTVQRVYDDERYQERKAKLEAEIERLNDEIAAFFVAVSELEGLVEQARSNYLAASDTYAAALRSGEGVSSARDAMRQAYQDMLDQQQPLVITRANQAKTKAARINARTELETITAREDPAPEEAWCADYTEDATGDLASIEVPGEPQGALIVYPQARGEGAFDRATHGQLMPREWMTGPQAYFNAAILPGWQKFKPMWRTGTIEAVEGDKASITLDEAVSTAQQLRVDDALSVADVPIEYMDCNGDVFQAGDRVVVEFQGQDRSQPRIIGFESEPRECGYTFLQVELNQPGQYYALTIRTKIEQYDPVNDSIPVSETWNRQLPADYSINDMAVPGGLPENVLNIVGENTETDYDSYRLVAKAGSGYDYYLPERCVLTTSDKGTLLGISDPGQDEVHVFDGSRQLVRSFSCLPNAASFADAMAARDGRVVVTGYDGNTGAHFARVYDYETGNFVADLGPTTSNPFNIQDVQWTADALSLIYWGDGADILMWDPVTLDPIPTVHVATSPSPEAHVVRKGVLALVYPAGTPSGPKVSLYDIDSQSYLTTGIYPFADAIANNFGGDWSGSTVYAR